jgi:hypothetical protein
MRTLFKLSAKVGFVPTILAVLVWLSLGTIAARAVVGALSRYPGVAYAVAVAVASITAIGGLVAFWLVADHIDFRRLGYRVKWLRANTWVYEERSPAPGARNLPYLREVRGRGYPEPCAVRIPAEATWEQEVPSWAHGRRSEILERIANCHGAKKGGEVEFLN